MNFGLKHLQPLIIIAIAAASRLVPHPPNFTPIVGLALFSGAQFGPRSRIQALIYPLAALLISDAILGFHAYMPFTYGAFAVITLLGSQALKANSNWLRLSTTALASSAIFFVISNFAVWLLDRGTVYPLNPSGLAACFAAAVPFFGNALVSDQIFTLTIFASYSLWAMGSLKRPVLSR